MKILFILPVHHLLYPFQIGALSSALKSEGHKTDTLILTVENDLSRKDFLEVEKTMSCKPDLIAFSSYEMNFEWIKAISDFIKKNYEVPIIVGGYHATLRPQEIIDHPSFDIVCIGEGEFTLLELLEKMEADDDITRIKNLWVKHKGTVIRNQMRLLVENLDLLPFVDRKIMDYQQYLDLKPKERRTMEIMAGRGCPFNCSYCCNHAFRQCYPNKDKYVRWRTVRNVLDEIILMSSEYQFEKIVFYDDTFTLSRKWLEEFCEKYPKEVDYPFSCNARPETCTIENLKMLKNAGCYSVSIGVESGDEMLRKHILRRHFSNSKIVQAFRNAKNVELKTAAFNMVGLPFETRVSILRTLMLNLKIAPDEIQTSVYYPFKGTALGDLCYEQRWVDPSRKKRIKLYAFDSVLNLPAVTQREVRIWKYLISLVALRRGNPETIKMICRSFKETLKHRSLDQGIQVALQTQ